MTEPDVVLTDYALAVEAIIFALLTSRSSTGHRLLGRWFVLFFCATAAASLAGGTVHGFFLDESTLGARILWPATLIAVGAAALAAWAIGAKIQFLPAGARLVARAAAVEFLIYAAAVVAGIRAFSVAIINYLPAAVFLLWVFASAGVRTRDRAFMLGAGAMVLTFIAAGVQWAQVHPAPPYLTHNSFYHLLQAISLFMLFASANTVIRRSSC